MVTFIYSACITTFSNGDENKMLSPAEREYLQNPTDKKYTSIYKRVLNHRIEKKIYMLINDLELINGSSLLDDRTLNPLTSAPDVILSLFIKRVVKEDMEYCDDETKQEYLNRLDVAAKEIRAAKKECD